ncbi:multiple sugar transport system permease protein [Actinopolymorpha cephalotaxi]|uniref:Multiple sugar transport system permease protein n=1 Tax=Actinopolymorpha cephalotaxi TaxID=504797 RepID=A0A1I3A7P1_9ACTN|nr:sugar ABC transporter permease [Actinopolymorpha cephalotaxi]NYH85291.1 multiple sugar transport system permease protein [Actinopolymorpha cephalotaxi]SFH46133.1 multiple sugar transport system permease protein [Actinopolymorpha cephalotaxi]
MSQSVVPSGRDWKRSAWIWLFLLPTVVLYGVYTLYPIIASYWYSLVEWNGFDSHQRFVGLANYQQVLKDPFFANSFKITLLFMVLVVPARVLLSLLLAVVLNSPRLPLVGVLRSAFFIPVVTTTAIIGVVMRFVLDPATGPVNSVLQAFGIDGVDFLGSQSTALPVAAVLYIWKFFGVTMIYWLAALQTIPHEIYEAARIDGASVRQIFVHITLPLLKPFLIIITVLTVEETFHNFDLMYTLTGGGPYFHTEIIEIYIYRWAFAASIPQLGHASAAAVLFGLLVAVVGAVQLWGVYAARRMRRSNP